MTKAFVSDTLAPRGKPRVHAIVTKMTPDGKSVLETIEYELFSEKPTEMDIEHAMQFLKDKAFYVADAEGNRIEPIPVEKDGGTGSLVLNKDEVIANLSELTKTALYKRCKALPGSEVITEKSPVQACIDFLISKARRTVRNSDADAALAEAGDKLSADELDEIGV